MHSNFLVELTSGGDRGPVGLAQRAKSARADSGAVGLWPDEILQIDGNVGSFCTGITELSSVETTGHWAIPDQ